MAKRTLYGTVIVTYRCNARCNMCDCFKDPTRPEEEITLDDIKKLPEMAFTNITGGEPFVRQDIPDIVRELYKKSDRIVISTNGYFTERIPALPSQTPFQTDWKSHRAVPDLRNSCPVPSCRSLHRDVPFPPMFLMFDIPC